MILGNTLGIVQNVEKEELKRRRTALGITQAELATVLGVKPNTVARWESGVLAVPAYLPLALETVERKKKAAKADRA